MIPADILLVLALVVIGGPVAWLAGRWLVAGTIPAWKRLIEVARARTRATVEDDYGDGGSRTGKGRGGYPWGQTETNDCDIDSGDQGGHPIPPEMQRAAARPKAPDTGSGLLTRGERTSTTANWAPGRVDSFRREGN